MPVDISAPKLLSLSIRDTSVSVGETLFIDYSIDDETGLDTSESWIYFVGPGGNRISARDYDSDGSFELEITEDFASGDYEFDWAYLADLAAIENFATYWDDGRVYENSEPAQGSDLSLSDLSFSVVTDAYNNPPVITSSAVKSVDANKTYSYSFTASDADIDDVLTMAADTLPEWLSFDPETGLLNGTPGNDEIGDHTVVLSVVDASGERITESFTITVNDVPSTDPVFDISVTKTDTDVYVLDIYANDLVISENVEDFQFDIDFGVDADFVVTDVEFSADPVVFGDYNSASAPNYNFGGFAMDGGLAADTPLISITGSTASGISELDFEVKNIDVNNTVYDSFDKTLSLASEMSGVISTRAGTPIEGATIDLKSVSDQSTLEILLSGTDGTFSTMVSEDVTLGITKSFENNRQITVRDALETLKLSLGKTKTDGTIEDLDFIAADFNLDGKVSVRDALEILKYSLKKGNYDAKWVFVESDMDTSTLSKGSVVYDDSISIELDSLVNPIDITAILVGDINGSV